MPWYGIHFQGLAEVSRVPHETRQFQPLQPLHLHYTPTLLTPPNQKAFEV